MEPLISPSPWFPTGFAEACLPKTDPISSQSSTHFFSAEQGKGRVKGKTLMIWHRNFVPRVAVDCGVRKRTVGFGFFEKKVEDSKAMIWTAAESLNSFLF